MTKTQKIGTAQMLACSLLWSMAGIMFKYIPWNGVVIASLRAAIAGAVVLAFIRIRGMELSVSAKTGDGLDELKVLENYIPADKSGDQKKLIQEE